MANPSGEAARRLYSRVKVAAVQVAVAVTVVCASSEALGFVGFTWTNADEAILRAMPQPLAAITQWPGPIMCLSGIGGVGPVGAAAFCLVVGGGIAAFGLVLRTIVRRVSQMVHDANAAVA